MHKSSHTIQCRFTPLETAGRMILFPVDRLCMHVESLHTPSLCITRRTLIDRRSRPSRRSLVLAAASLWCRTVWSKRCSRHLSVCNLPEVQNRMFRKENAATKTRRMNRQYNRDSATISYTLQHPTTVRTSPKHPLDKKLKLIHK